MDEVRRALDLANQAEDDFGYHPLSAREYADALAATDRIEAELARLREELKDTRENSWGLDEAIAYEKLEAENARLREEGERKGLR